MQKITIISTGGTFNKIYNPKTGELEIDKSSKALQELAKKWLCHIEVVNLIGKDSLEMTQEDRNLLIATIKKCENRNMIVVHGTDTMEITAKALAKAQLQKNIVLTGAMVPFSIDPIEATANLASAYGYLQNVTTYGVTIAMNGLIDHYLKVKKDRTKGQFVP
jgi:L-asparaginase